jgi:hypothetical protein
VNGIGNKQGRITTWQRVPRAFILTRDQECTGGFKYGCLCGEWALHGNNCSNLLVTNNLFFGNSRTSSLQRFAGAELYSQHHHKKKYPVPLFVQVQQPWHNDPSTTKEADIYAMGTFDSNYYCLGRNGDGWLPLLPMQMQ